MSTLIVIFMSFIGIIVLYGFIRLFIDWMDTNKHLVEYKNGYEIMTSRYNDLMKQLESGYNVKIPPDVNVYYSDFDQNQWGVLRQGLLKSMQGVISMQSAEILIELDNRISSIIKRQRAGTQVQPVADHLIAFESKTNKPGFGLKKKPAVGDDIELVKLVNDIKDKS